MKKCGRITLEIELEKLSEEKPSDEVSYETPVKSVKLTQTASDKRPTKSHQTGLLSPRITPILVKSYLKPRPFTPRKSHIEPTTPSVIAKQDLMDIR